MSDDFYTGNMSKMIDTYINIENDVRYLRHDERKSPRNPWFDHYDTAEDSPREYYKLNDAERAALDFWVQLMFHKTNRMCRHDTYTMKHHLERATGLYVTNGQFKGAMLEASYFPMKLWKEHRNWYFAVSPHYVIDYQGQVRLIGLSVQDIKSLLTLIDAAKASRRQEP